MGIKEIIGLGMMAVATIAVIHGPHRLTSELRKIQFQILKEVGHTNNWGNPDIYQYQSMKKHEKVKPFLKSLSISSKGQHQVR